MASVNKSQDLPSESVEITYQDLATLEDVINALDSPWLAEEGPLSAEFWQLPEGGLPRQLLPRGLAFDSKTTVLWSEDQVQIIQAAFSPPAPRVLPRPSTVLVRSKNFSGLERLKRIDYLREGVVLASRYLPDAQESGDDHA